MLEVAIYPAYVVAVHYSGQQPPPPFGPSSFWSYDIWVNFPSGAQLCPRMVPVEERYDDSWNVIPLKVNRAVQVGVVKGQLQLMASEKLHIAPCGAAP